MRIIKKSVLVSARPPTEFYSHAEVDVSKNPLHGGSRPPPEITSILYLLPLVSIEHLLPYWNAAGSRPAHSAGERTTSHSCVEHEVRSPTSPGPAAPRPCLHP
ncbi:hypothetical protein EVAR_37094_1 [Eumeta japonica]|uniref:Uncharacterized protein n=1 Tax=Eumeta variegata TaxID=151549 RepID=A0A4C1XST5_EUMVA|nr:hypothetical protein EVAR_37094_1 [Eumeta japonica]